MNFDIAAAIEAGQKILAAAQAAAPLVQALGLPGSGLVKPGLDIIGKVLERIEEGAEVASTEDVARLNAILAALQAENDEYIRRVDAS